MGVDPILTRIGDAARLHHYQGRSDTAHELLTRIWDEIGGERGDPLHVCVLAHTIADVQDDVEQELMWDLRALAVADLVTDERIAQAGMTFRAAGLYPSLHLNVCGCYRKPGDLDRAREHLRQARTGIAALPDDEYGRLIKDGLEQLTEQLG